MKKVIIAEKPSLAMKIVKAIGKMKKNDGYFENEKYIVTFAFGHLLVLKDVDDYKNREKTKWNLEEIPFFPEKFEYKLPNDTGIQKQYKIISTLITRTDVDEIVNCGDADREGEVIANNIIYRVFKEKNISKRVTRLWLQELTVDTIRKQLNNLKPIENTKNLMNEGIARTDIDWLYGINLTRYVSLKKRAMFPVGRVLVPTLKYIYDRDKEIENFKVKKYYEIDIKVKKENEEMAINFSDFKFDTNDEAENILNQIKNNNGIVTNIEEKIVQKFPQKLFSLDTIQNYLFTKNKYSLDKTLSIIQKLYESGYVTYPRTNSEYLAEEEKVNVNQILDKLKQEGFNDIEMKDSKKIFDSSKVESHSALIITTKIPNEDDFLDEEKVVYNAIKNRFLANFCNEQTNIAETKIKIKIKDTDYEGSINGKIIKDKGFLKYENNIQEKKMPKFIENEEVELIYEIKEKQTIPPKKVTEKELNIFFKNPSKEKITDEEIEEQIVDDDVYENIKEGVEIGTVATRANIIKNLKRYEYINVIKNSLVCSDKGKELIETLIKLEINLWKEKTVEMSKYLKKIFNNTTSINEVVKLAEDEIANICHKDKEVAIFEKKKNILGKCPICQKEIVERKDFYGCEGYKEGCKFTISKSIAGKKITETQVKQLLTKGITNKITGFKGKNGNFNAKLELNEGKIKFKFD